MNIGNYIECGFELHASAIDKAAALGARDWILQHRNRSDIPSTQEAFSHGLPGPIKLRRLWQADPAFWTDFMLTSGVLDIAGSHLGIGYLLIRSASFIKYPQSLSEVGWHRDLDLWGHGVDAGLTIWIPLTPVPIDSGCLAFLSGSHRRAPGPLRFDLKHPYHRVMDPTGLGDAVRVPAEVGDCVLMNAATVHSSGPNHSLDERIALVLAFANCSVDHLTESAVVFGPSGAQELGLLR
ncbi:UNVERIFIED_ORG: hypothetical protein BTE55_09835 [Rhizobium sophorae]